MREWMAKISDYLNERRNDPERQENRLAAAVTGGVAVVVIALLAVLLWGYGGREHGRGTEEEIQEVQIQKSHDRDAQSQEASGPEAQMISEEKVETVHEEAVRYMSEDSGEQLRQEYLTSTAYLQDKVKELLETMTQVQKELAKAQETYRESSETVREQIDTLCTEVGIIVQRLEETQVNLAELTEIIQVVDQEKIPVIQQQIQGIRKDMERVRTDMAGVHLKIAALEKEDEKLWESIGSLEKDLKTALERDVTDVNQRVDAFLGQMEERLQRLAEGTLAYRYEAESNTLYLAPADGEEGGL